MNETVKALKWAIEIIEIAEKNCPNMDWSIGHFGRKERAKKVLEQLTNS